MLHNLNPVVHHAMRLAIYRAIEATPVVRAQAESTVVRSWRA